MTSSVLLALVIGLALLWRQAVAQAGDPSRLSSKARQELAAKILEDSPGVHQAMSFEPRIAYTLRPNARLEAWGDTFTTNTLGYRAPAPRKPAGTFRVLFVGDSWTYGMGLRRGEAFPALVERTAERLKAAGDRKVEAWSLALPGYNLVNELEALRYWFEDLEPDAVMVVPSSNDNHGSGSVLPNGSLWRGSPAPDDLGGPHTLTYHIAFVGSFASERRWAESMAMLRAAEVWLAKRKVPLTVLFLARWRTPVAHSLVAAAGIAAPYAVVQPEFTLGKWMDPAFEHGTAAANVRFAEIAYELLASQLAWPRDAAAAYAEVGTVFPTLPPDGHWRAQARALREQANQRIATELKLEARFISSTVGPIDLETGVVGRSTTIQLRRVAREEALAISLETLASHPSLYPLAVVASIPSAAGGTRARVVLGVDGATSATFEVAIPSDVAVGDVMDLELVAEHAAASGTREGEAYRVRSVTPGG